MILLSPLRVRRHYFNAVRKIGEINDPHIHRAVDSGSRLPLEWSYDPGGK
jgi:hypothetical protein